MKQAVLLKDERKIKLNLRSKAEEAKMAKESSDIAQTYLKVSWGGGVEGGRSLPSSKNNKYK